MSDFLNYLNTIAPVLWLLIFETLAFGSIWKFWIYLGRSQIRLPLTRAQVGK